MLGITGRLLEPIYELSKRLDPDCNTEKLGAWGILFLCCGAMAGGNSLWKDIIKNSDTFVCSSEIAKLLERSEVCTSDDYAVRFSESIKEWSNSSHAIAVAEERIEKYRGQISETAFFCYKKWATLAYILNSLRDMTREKLLGFDCREWVSVSSSKTESYGWPELFFAAGFLLRAEAKVSRQKMASAIHGMNKPHKDDVAELFEHYAGKKLFMKAKKI